MKHILVCCNAGVSTSLLVQKLKREAELKGLDVAIEARPLADAVDHLNDADLVLLGPQIGYAQGSIQETTDVPVQVIDPDLYARADAAGILETVEL
ncbi:PTS sugar transporter subunit IIB [Collinsella sp. zg1085]|uniref:PTS sugar transporter subunit IIB n=1 Tax=Collinsella sp. zg1085 TaxID=2844380 RepID=UPI001C0BBAE6|nr:PTS sugar transporter subunit IIB [Collinsella sp. zg1085]QWT17436.1 PTS sugar transporter subunit IIB [Collinsella sp. zg1085]